MCGITLRLLTRRTLRLRLARWAWARYVLAAYMNSASMTSLQPGLLVRAFRTAQSWNNRRVERLNLRRRERERYEFRLGVLGIMKDEALNIAEWVEHYLWQGAERIYLIDNGSTDDSVKIVQPWIEQGVVKLISCPEPWRQREHYMTAAKRFRIARECEWLLVADIDEFWFCKDGTSLSDKLADYDEAAVIYVSWSIFGSSGHVEHPASLRAELVMRQDRLPARHLCKWICRTKAIRRVKNIEIHHVYGTCSAQTLTDNDTFQINHYQIQSVEFFQKSKMRRGDAVHRKGGDFRTMEYFDAVDRMATIADRRLADMVLRAKAEADAAKS